MPLLPVVGKRTKFYRCLIVCTYLLLGLGGLTMVGPFWVMLVKSVSSKFDVEVNQWWPLYLTDSSRALAVYEGQLHYEGNLQGDLDTVLTEWGLPPLSEGWKRFHPPMPDFQSDEPLRVGVKQMESDWEEFRRWLALSKEGICFTGFATVGSGEEAWEKFLLGRYGSLLAVGEAHHRPPGEAPPLLNEVFPLRLSLELDAELTDARDFRMQVASSSSNADLPKQITVRLFDKDYRNFLRLKYGDRSQLRKAWGNDAPSFEGVFFHDAPPKEQAQRKDWLQFVTHHFPATLITLEKDQAVNYRQFLENSYGTVQRYNEHHQQPIASFEAAPFSTHFPSDPSLQNDWGAFLEQISSPAAFHVQTADSLRIKWLQTRYHGDVERLNAAWGTHFPNFEQARFNTPLIDAWYVHEHLAQLRWRYLTDNYRTVFSFLITKGMAAINTLILVGLTLASTLSINPFAAYALSRFRLKWERAILVFLIATLAFPAEVAMIPGFTLTKGLGLLNTYWALILPGLASGMGIFILKGFFDSLPLELYEAAALDGAGEFRIFWQITLPLSSPIIAVNALAAFVSAYTSWNWALLICQDPSMWTIAVYLFQFQIISNHQGLIFASLIVGSIPTLLIFLFCQRIIMRGIVLPSLK